MHHTDSDYPKSWLGKRYYSLDAYCKTVYQEKLYKIAIDAGCTCPNRDGTLDTRGCIFCSAGGSGDFAVSRENYPSITEQLETGKTLFHDKNIGSGFIAYFQSYTNTYGDIHYLENIFDEALACKDVRGISIATRPDCISSKIIEMLSSLREKHSDKFIWIELGLQSIHERTAAFIRRGYDLSVYYSAVTMLVNSNFPVITHLILGLPGETKADYLESIEYLNKLWETVSIPRLQDNQPVPVFGVKLQLLHVLRGTDLAACFERNEFEALSKGDYLEWVVEGLEHLSPEIVIHRLTGDGPKDLLIAPLWSLNKRDVLNSLTHKLKVENTWQGKEYHGSTYDSPL